MADGWPSSGESIPTDPTPAHELEDGVDYVPAPPYVVLGHHFSSIAGAGPINGPIQAAVFGWVPVLLWVLIGGIFFGAMHDFGALFASHSPQGPDARRRRRREHRRHGQEAVLHLRVPDVLSWWWRLSPPSWRTRSPWCPTWTARRRPANLANQQTAIDLGAVHRASPSSTASLTRGRKHPRPGEHRLAPSCVIVIMVAIGYNLPLVGISLSLDYTTWMIILGVYILIASVAPVWILLQPRDYLSSYLLYGMIIAGRHRHRGRGHRGRCLRPADPRVHRLRRHERRVRCLHGSGPRRPGRHGHDEQGRRIGLPVPGAVHHHRLRRHLRLP